MVQQLKIAIDEIQNITFTGIQEGTIETLLEWMTGSFSSEAQAETSTDPYHVDVRLHMIRIWSDRPGYWVYVEQAYATSQNNPYRQRIYRVFEENGILQDEIYAIPNAGNYVGSYATPQDFDVLQEIDLELKDGCDVFFSWQEDHFYGSTEGQQCTASIPGVAYLTSETTIFPNYLTSWDLGYNASGVIVMGPYSPYIFDKLENYSFFDKN